MPLLHGKQLQNSSVILNKLSGTGSLVLQTGAVLQVPLANISNPTDVVNKQYVDNIAVGMNTHAAVKTATTGNLSLTTATVSPVISGYTVSTNDRILVWQQSITASNGIYVYNGSTFSRAADQDGNPSSEIAVGDYTFVTSGNYAGNGYVIVASGTYSGVLEPVDVAPIVWSQFTGPGQFTWSNGLINTGSNVISVNLAGGSGLTFSSGALTINSTIAGNGLAWSSGVLSVNTANGIAISGGNVQLSSTVAGTGLTYPGAGVISIANTGVSANTYGSANTVPSVTFNAQGQAIAATAVSISVTSGQVSNFTSSVTGLVGAGTGISVNNSGGAATVSIANTGVASGSYGAAGSINTISVNAQGQLTSVATQSISITSGQVSNFTASVQGLAVTSVNAGTGVSVAQVGGVATVSIANTGVVSGSYGAAGSVNTFSVNAQGQLTTVATQSISITSGQVSNFTASVQLLATQVAAGTGITVSTVGGVATVSIANTAVTATTYGNAATVPSVTFNAQGQAIAATAVSISITSGQVSNFTSSVSSLITASFGTPVYTQRNLTPVNTTGNGASSSLTITSTPKNIVNVSVYVNGQLQYLGNGTSSNVDCYFSTQSSTARSISNITAGDTLFWNGTYVGFDLSTTDKVDIIYNV